MLGSCNCHQNQLQIYLTHLKAKIQGPASVNLADLIQWAESCKAVPEDEDKAFVADFYFSFNPDVEDDEANFHIGLPNCLMAGIMDSPGN